MSFGKSLRKIWPALVVACFGFSGLMASDAFAEVTDPVCKTLIAHADVEGEWSPAVTVCAGKADDGTTILMSMAGTSDYYRAGANTSGVAGTAKIDVDDEHEPERGAVFYGIAGTGTITVGGLNWWDPHDSGGSFTATSGEYNGDPGKFIDDVLNGGKGQMGVDSLTRTRHIPSRGGTTIQGATCAENSLGGPQCDDNAKRRFENLVKSRNFSIEDCNWVLVSEYGTPESGVNSSYNLVCGAEPQHDVTITYALEVVPESEDVAKAVAEGVATNGVQVGTSDNVKDLCYGMGVDDQGWFLCPSLSNMTYTASWIDNLIQEWLSVDPSLYNSSSSTYAVWTAMRDIANVLMIILLLVVIFSQLTGFGIDNYGIKKMLPRLITMAVLINLSFVICELAVDLSNVLGVGLRDMFGAWGESLNSGQNVNGTDFIATVVTGILGLTTAGGAMAGTIIAGVMTGEVAGVLIVILALVAVIAAVLLFFVGLAARMVMVILCIAVAPVAFALFILPNTQSIFKKWWDIFKVALLMFPICGALGGISNLIKGMVRANQGDFMMLVIGLIAPFLAFFLLPSMLKGMVAMLGQIGGALQNMGQSLTGGARNLSGAIQNSDRFQKRAEYDKERTAARRAERVQQRLRSRQERNGGLSARDQRRLRVADDTALAFREGRLKDEASVRPSRFEARQEAMRMKAWDEETEEALTLAKSEGITMENGSRVAWSRGAAVARVEELELAARDRALNAGERQTLAALSRGLSQEKGGASKLNDIIRDAQDGNGGVNRNFMAAMGQVYSQDAAVASKMSEKDGTMASYMEGFVPGGNGSESYAQAAANGSLENRAKSYEAGLSQGGAALGEYIGGLSKQDCQNIYNQGLESALDADDLATFQAHAANLGVTGTEQTMAAQDQVAATQALSGQLGQVKILGHGAYEAPDGSVWHLREMSDGTYRDDGGFTVDITHFKKK